MGVDLYNNLSIGKAGSDQCGPVRYDRPKENEANEIASGFMGMVANIFTQAGIDFKNTHSGSVFIFNPAQVVQAVTVFPKHIESEKLRYRVPFSLTSEDPNLGIWGSLFYKHNALKRIFSLEEVEEFSLKLGEDTSVKLTPEIIVSRAPDIGLLATRPDVFGLVNTLVSAQYGKIIDPAKILWGDQADRETLLFGIYNKMDTNDVHVDPAVKKIFFRKENKDSSLFDLRELPITFDLALRDAIEYLKHTFAGDSKYLQAVGRLIRNNNNLLN